MMNGIRRFLNKNMNKIIVWIVLIVAVIAVIQVLDYFSGIYIESQNIVGNEIREEQEVEQSVVTGQNITTTQKKQITIIDSFFNNINEDKFEEAYNMISDDCKEELYKDLNTFIDNYVNVIYKGTEISYEIENWIGSTYKVDVESNPIITGIKEENKQDYITITTTEKDEKKLNINNFIRRVDEDRSVEKSDIKIEVLHVDVYKEYKEYTFKVSNKTSDEVALGEIQKEKAIYIVDEKGIEYNWAMNELSERELFFYPGETREVEIKFYSNYLYNNSIENIIFNNVFKIIDFEGGVDFIEYKFEL